MRRSIFLFLCLSACHLTESGSISRTCEDLAVGCQDGGGDDSGTESFIDQDEDGYTADVDCDDEDAEIHPGADEICDGLDNDCDAATDSEDDSLIDGLEGFSDDDGDGFGNAESPLLLCEESAILVDNDQDCDDGDSSVFPGADEVCDGIDSDCDGAADSNMITMDGQNFETINSALAASVDDATIYVCDGIYAESLIIERSVRLISIGGADNTTLMAAPGTSAVRIRSGSVTIDGLSLESGSGSPWSGGSGGGAIYVEAGSLTVNRCILTGNQADIGGAIFADEFADSLEILDSTIDGNQAAYYGGGIFSYGPPVTIDNTDISNNSAPYGGGIGGISILLDITGGSIHNNESDSAGGGIWLIDSTLTLTDTAVKENFSSGDGGGIHLDVGQLSCSGETSIVGNVAGDHGGGLKIEQVTVEGCSIQDNTALYGGGVAAAYGDSQFADSDIEGNTAISWGGGMITDIGASVTLDNTHLDANTAAFGGGLYVFGESQVNLIGGSIKTTEATESGGGLRLALGSVDAVSTDFGSGVEDNSPDDISLSGSSTQTTGLGSGTSFSCSVNSTAATCSF